MNGHELGSWSRNALQSYCGQLQVPGSISENRDDWVGTDDVGTGVADIETGSACAVGAAATSAVIKISEARTRRIVKSWG
jgi:hypothetical protein